MGALELHQWAAGAYLAASIAAVSGLGVRARRWLRFGVWLLAFAALLHGFAFLELHRLEPTPALTELPLAVSLAAWLLALAFLALQLRVPARGLAVVVAPAAFLGTVFAAFSASPPEPPEDGASALWSHLHVLLASGGLALLGVAGAAGLLYLVHHRAIKRHRVARHSALPPLESLDRANAVALALGFLLLSLGVVTGVLWVETREGRLWPGGLHANATLVAWLAYSALVFARFGAGGSARSVAFGSAAGFALLLAAVVGIGVAR